MIVTKRSDPPWRMPCNQPRWASLRLSIGTRGPSLSAHTSSAKFHPRLMGLEKQLQARMRAESYTIKRFVTFSCSKESA